MRTLPALAVALLASAASAQPDLAIADLTDAVHTGSVNSTHGYAVGFTVCNQGNTLALWQSNTNQHPVQSWGVYRIRSGRIEQLGVSWLKHGNFAAATPGCGGTCDTNLNGARLGPNCRDTYDGAFNSSAFGLGSRVEVNPASGVFPWPPTGYGQTGNTIFKMAQVAQADLANPGATYLIEGVLVHPQDAAAGLTGNNAAYRLQSVNASTFAMTNLGTTQAAKPAIQAWRDHGLGVNQPDPSVSIIAVDIPSDGRVWVASKATDLGNGLWHYEYAVENVNSQRCVSGFSAPMPPSATPSSLGFHDVSYHSGDTVSPTDWGVTTGQCRVAWTTTPFATSPTANAIRWGTLYNFRFDAPVAPVTGHVRLDLFRPPSPGGDTSINAIAVVPGPGAVDFNHDSVQNPDDLGDFITGYFSSPPDAATDFNSDGAINPDDLGDFITAFFTVC